MNKVSYKQFFATLSCNRRLDILQHLQKEGSQNVSEIAKAINQEQSAVSHNLNKLLACECVHVEARGKHRYYSLNEETIVPLLSIVEKHIQKYCHGECKNCGPSTAAEGQKPPDDTSIFLTEGN